MDTLPSYEILERAADVMEKKGWNSGNRHHPNGTVCVLGALEDVLHGGHYLTYNEPILPLLVKEIGLTAMSLPGDKPTSGLTSATQLAQWSNRSDGPTVVGYLRKIAQRLMDAVTVVD